MISRRIQATPVSRRDARSLSLDLSRSRCCVLPSSRIKDSALALSADINMGVPRLLVVPVTAIGMRKQARCLTAFPHVHGSESSSNLQVVKKIPTKAFRSIE